MKNPITDIKARIADIIGKGVTTTSGLAKAAGLHRNSLYGCSDPESWNPKSATLEQVFPALVDMEKKGENTDG